MGGPPVTVPVPGKAVAVTGGAYHSVVLNEAGAVYTFGANQLGQLGRSLSSKAGVDGAGLPIDAYPRAVEVVSASGGYAHTTLFCENGNVYTFGNNENGQLGLGSEEGMRTECVCVLFKVNEELNSSKIT